MTTASPVKPETEHRGDAPQRHDRGESHDETIQRIQDYSLLTQRMQWQVAELTHHYPDQWAAMAPNGETFVDLTQAKLLSALEEKGIDCAKAHFEFLDSTLTARFAKENRPQIYLPKHPAHWRERMQALIHELRSPDLNPGLGHLYAKDEAGNLSACIEGVINEMAVRGGMPAAWAEMEIEGPDDGFLTIWEIYPPYRAGEEDPETVNRALPEALSYHGFNMPDGRFLLDVLDCDLGFIREAVNERHGVIFGAQQAENLNDDLVKQGANPLRLAADVLEHLMDRPSNAWDERVNPWIKSGESTPRGFEP